MRSSGASIFCCQESKLAALDRQLVVQSCGSLLDNFEFIPSDGSRGGLFISWRADRFAVSCLHKGTWSLTLSVTNLEGGAVWTLTNVYGPQAPEQKVQFLNELTTVGQHHVQGAWCIVGDFNLLATESDKNNQNVDRRMINRFRCLLNLLELRELYLFGRRFTWSSEQESPTLTKIDKVLVNAEWEDFFRDAHLQALSSSASDHCPLLLACDAMVHRPRRFKFEAFWLHLDGFDEIVRAAWESAPTGSNAFSSLHFKLKATATALKPWGAHRICELRLQLAVAHEVILQLDRAMDSRQLSPEERSLRATLKGRCLALASLERIRLRQRARLRYLKHSGTASQFFHLKINARRRKKTIPMIQHGGVWGVTEEDKLDMAHDYFCSIMGSPSPPSAALDLGRLGLPSLDLSELEVEITEDEAKKVMLEMPVDRAPGPDGFGAAFYRRCWNIVKDDVVAALNLVFNANSQHLHLLNTASIILLPKKDDPTQLADYRPISLIHSFIKLFTKVLATRLAARMNELVGPAQSAFIKSRRIQENFLYVQGVVRKIHRAKCPAVLLKLDIAKAFDSVSWEFLIELLRHLGFGSKWRDCIAVLLGSSSTTVCINGQDTHRIRLARGLRQGDPLSPLLFDLVMETFAALCNTAVCRGALSPLTGGVLPLRTSLYADDAIIFFHPSSMDAASIRCLLSMMGAATGLVSNYSKSSITPIHCSQEQIDEVADVLGCPVRQLPIKYLGLPLSVRKPVKADIQPLMDRLGKNLAGWKPKLLGPDARLAIIKHVLMTLPLYFMSVLELPSWAIKEIERKCRGFLWKGDENAAGTCSLVA